MSHRREIRRLAMQILYQIDLRGEVDLPTIEQSLTDGPDPVEIYEPALVLARAAWNDRTKADTLASELAPTWPTLRQPPVDRALLRLAYHEMASGYSPVKVAINEAVELAKHYCGEQSPAFLNGVLDKMARRLAAGAATAMTETRNPNDELHPGANDESMSK